jgi:hypothetical protein
MVQCVLMIAREVSASAPLLLLMFTCGCRPAANDALFSGQVTTGASQGRVDLDGDGVDDCWKAEESNGTGIGGAILTIEAPCGSEALTLDTTSSFADFLARTPLPSELATRPHLVEGIAGLLYGREHVRAASAIDDSFRLLLGNAPRWSTGRPRVPPSQVIIRNDPDEMIAYFAHNHGPLRSATRCEGIDVLTTRHGVVLYDGQRDESSWVYIANGHEKLRRPSIMNVSCGDRGTLVIQGRSESLVVPIRRSSSL